MFSIGQVVFSKRGRDKGLPFVVIMVEAEYAFLADGSLRKFAAPKKKKFKHIQPTKNVLFDVQEKILARQILDSDLRKALLPFRSAPFVNDYT